MRFLAALLALAPLAHAQARRLPTDAASIEAGRQLYLGSCSGCHGATGEGSQGPSLLSGRASRLSNQALFSTIQAGLPGTTMPNFPLPDEKVATIAAFVRSLTTPAIANRAPGDAARGEALFFGAARCSTCHMIRGQGGHPGPDLSDIAAARTLPQLREAIAKPGERIAEGYRAASATLRNGTRIAGVAKNYNNYSVQILDQSGRLHLLQRTDWTALSVEDRSLMPPLADAAQAQDLIAFLARLSLRPYNEGASQ
ncbi:MAG: c-type cytochrome [Bryobacterales bacterium]|nr:c-type cytochrome [Bryobacterales bacterium]